jgi:toxin-antitoxin system PIN domain toxin
LNDSQPIGIATPTIVAFLRRATDGRVFSSPLTIDDAISAIDALLAHGNVTVLGPGDRHFALFTRILRASRATRDLIPDAHLAAIALEHGGTIATNDRDFDRFAGVTVDYPLATE